MGHSKIVIDSEHVHVGLSGGRHRRGRGNRAIVPRVRRTRRADDAQYALGRLTMREGDDKGTNTQTSSGRRY